MVVSHFKSVLVDRCFTSLALQRLRDRRDLQSYSNTVQDSWCRCGLVCGMGILFWRVVPQRH